MTLQQFRRMCVFASRMVKLQPARYRKQCRTYVADMLHRMSVENHDVHYPFIIDWDNSETHTREERLAHGFGFYKASLLCDYLTAHNGLAEYDSNLSRETRNSEGNYDTVLLNCVQVCLCAACDVAVAPSGDVVGYDVGDLKAMWHPKPIPQWVSAAYGVDFNQCDSNHAVWL